MKEEKIILNKNTRYPLNGLLTLPDETDTKVPAVVFVHGSGASNMDEKVGKLTPFKDLAQGLASHGIASLRYDKRSFAHGLRMLRDKEIEVTVKSETIDDALAAANLLKDDERIGKVYIIGHSMGAMLAPRINDEGGSFDGLIMMAGSPRHLTEIMIDQFEDLLSKQKGLIRWIISKQLEKNRKLFEKLPAMDAEEARKKKMGGGTTLYYFKEMMEHPASDYLLKTGAPMLIMQGEKDFQVGIEKDFKAYQKLLAHKDNATFKLYKNLNHAFVPSVYGDITRAKQEYNNEQHIGEDVISDIADWIKKSST